MIDTSSLNAFGVVAIGFVPSFVCSLFLRAKGLAGLISIIGLISLVLIILTDFQDWKFAVGGMAALVGLTIGGSISDANERKKMVQKQELDRRERKKMLG